MTENRLEKNCVRCCIYDLEANQLYRNMQLQKIKSYGDIQGLDLGV